MSRGVSVEKGFRPSGDKVATPGGAFTMFVPTLYKGGRGKVFMTQDDVDLSGPLAVRLKDGKKGQYYVVRAAREDEEKKFIFVLSAGGAQDRRESYGSFKILEAPEGAVMCDLYSGWGGNQLVILALREGETALIENDPGSGYKGRDPRPVHQIRLHADGRQEVLADPEYDVV